MTDKEIKNAIIAQLQTDIQDWDVCGSPLNLNNFRCTHPNGHILVKSSGNNNTRATTGQPLGMPFSPYVSNETKWVIFVISDSLNTDDEYLDIKERIVESTKLVRIEGASLMYWIAGNEPLFDEEKQYVFAELIFSIFKRDIDNYD